MTEFQELLYKALQEGASVYDAFISSAVKRLPLDSQDRYEWLRDKGRFVCRDEWDVNVYVDKVAHRHIPKFTWLYKKLFEQFSGDFSGEIDIVIWGCGCGLDLLALYDVALRQKNPQLWLSVRSIILLDLSESAIERAKDVAEVLFPMARRKIFKIVCDFTKIATFQQKIEDALRQMESFIYVPRLHLISNVVDLFHDLKQVEIFAQTMKRCSRREYKKRANDNQSGESRSYYNEIVVAFSPEYGGGNRVSQNLRALQRGWGGKFVSKFVDDLDIPKHCAYSAFTYRTLRSDSLYRKYYQGNPLLRSIVSQLKTEDKDVLLKLISVLARFKIGGNPLLNIYKWVDFQYSRNCLMRVMFVAKSTAGVCPLLIKLRDPKGIVRNVHDLAMASLFKKLGEPYEDKTDWRSSLQLLAWNPTRCKLEFGEKNSEVTQELIDNNIARLGVPRKNFEQFFVIDPRGAKPLPPLDSLDEKQKMIAYSRIQKRKVRGGAGCGKTTTMLWHGVLAILRTRMPVLLVCKTVTLFHHNQRRMAATLLKELPGLECVNRNLIQFCTVDDVLCKVMKDSDGCEIKKCGCCKRQYQTLCDRMDDKIKEEKKLMESCGKDPLKAATCEILLKVKNHNGSVGTDLSENEKDARCNACKEKIIAGLARKGSRYWKGVKQFGAILVDEVQSIEPEKVQAVFNLSYDANPWREFYVFCDERQCQKEIFLESDPDAHGKLRVRVPDRGKGFGRWIVLSSPHRQMSEFSGKLALVSSAIQRLTNTKFGEVETEKVPYQENLLQGVFAVRMATAAWENDVFELIEDLKRVGATRITVVCDYRNAVDQLLGVPETKWNSTHKTGASFQEEQRLRNDFEEREGITNLTTIDLAQGWTLESVILVVSDSLKEKVFTGVTRATKHLRVLDRSPDQWVYNCLKGFN